MEEQKTNLENEIKELGERSAKLEKLYEEQEKLLDEIFDGEYGSDDENRMENILDQHEQMRSRVVEANFKWRQAQLMVDYAYKQLEHAVKKWEEVASLGERFVSSNNHNSKIQYFYLQRFGGALHACV